MAVSPVYFYVPNIVGYFRLFLIGISWLLYDKVYLLIPLYSLQMFLDCIDGILARRLNQCSSFGAWLDVLADIIGRSILWSRLYQVGIIIVSLEWTVFVCTHSVGGTNWKEKNVEVPSLVKRIMRNGFYNPFGVFVIAGLHGLPLCLYVYQHHLEIPYLRELSNLLMLVPVGILVIGRALGMYAEVWYVAAHINLMVLTDETDKTVEIPDLKLPQEEEMLNLEPPQKLVT